MIDIFSHNDISKLLKYKNIVFLGDSNIRAIYKDFLCLLTSNEFIPEKVLKNKMESTCFGDKLNYHGSKTNGRDYREERGAKINGTNVSFFFLTRVYDTYVKGVLREITCRQTPDVVVINSCLWDVTRWGPMGVEDYKLNLKELMQELKKQVPDSLVIWVTTPPIAQEVKGGFLLRELQFFQYSLRFHVVEANHFARKVVVESGFDVLDTHYHLKLQIQKRSSDGIHWYADTVRFVSNLLLTHISLAWDEPLPHRYNSEAMQENLNIVLDEDVSTDKDVKVNIQSEASTSGSQGTTQKGKENLYDLPKDLEKPKREEKTSNRWTKNHNRQTHHAYFSRQDYEKRVKRVKQSKRRSNRNRSPAGKFSYSDSGYLSNLNLRGIRQSYQETLAKRTVEFTPPSSSFCQYDSGYFSSPTQSYSPYSPYQPCSPVPRTVIFSYPNMPQPHPFTPVPVPHIPTYHPNMNFTNDDMEGYYFD